MWKRVLASLVGIVAVIFSIVPFGSTFRLFRDLRNPAVPFWDALIILVVTLCVGFSALLIGIRFLRFGWAGKSKTSNAGWVRAFVLSVGCFFPGFVFSLPITLLWARYKWPGDGQSPLAAMQMSLYIGVLTSIVSGIVLIRNMQLRNRMHRHCDS